MGNKIGNTYVNRFVVICSFDDGKSSLERLLIINLGQEKDLEHIRHPFRCHRFVQQWEIVAWESADYKPRTRKPFSTELESCDEERDFLEDLPWPLSMVIVVTLRNSHRKGARLKNMRHCDVRQLHQRWVTYDRSIDYAINRSFQHAINLVPSVNHSHILSQPMRDNVCLNPHHLRYWGFSYWWRCGQPGFLCFGKDIARWHPVSIFGRFETNGRRNWFIYLFLANLWPHSRSLQT